MSEAAAVAVLEAVVSEGASEMLVDFFPLRQESPPQVEIVRVCNQENRLNQDLHVLVSKM